MMAGLKRSAAACRAAASATARKALSFLRKPILARFSLLDEAVAVEVVGGLEREERRHPHDHGAENLVADIEVVVREAAPLRRQDAVIGVLCRELRHGDAERRPLLHALENEVDAVGVRPHHLPQPRPNMVFLAHALLGPLNGDVVVACKGLDPVLVVGAAPAQHLLADHRNADHLAQEVGDLLGSRQPAQVAVDDNAIEAVIDEDNKIAEQLDEQFHGRPPKTHQAWTGQAHGEG